MVETNEAGYNQFAGLIHHRTVGDDYTAGFGIGGRGGKGSVAVELTDVTTKTIVARQDIYANSDNGITIKLTGASYTGCISVKRDGIYVQFGNNAEKKIS